MQLSKYFIFTALILLLTSCHHCNHNKNQGVPQIKSTVSVHQGELPCQYGAYKYIPKNRYHIRNPGTWLTWAFFGNDDDGIYGEKPSAGNWTQEKICSKRAFLWWWRNPMHNFCFYVIGSADKQNDEFALIKLAREGCDLLKYHKKAHTVFAGESTSFFIGFHSWKPFVSLRLDYGRLFDFYIGWRERGNFGIKCVLAGRKKNMVSSAQSSGNGGKSSGDKKKI